MECAAKAMAMLSAADIQAMIEATVRGALQGQAAAGPQQPPAREECGAGHGGHLDERHFRRIDKFEGAESKWKEWSFQMKTAIGTINPKVRGLLEEIQKDPTEVDWDLMFGNLNDQQVEQMGAEPYGLTVLMTTWEALTVVRGVAGGNGWHAWQQLVIRCNPKTPARALMAMMAVMQPRKVKDVRELQGAVQ